MKPSTSLGKYLRARRELVRPEDVKVRCSGRRRVPGLRREELAMLAGISPDYYRPDLWLLLLRGLDGVRAHPDLDDAHERLTDRELEVLRLLAGGYSNAEIAGALGVAERTVKNHISSVLAKLDVRDRTRAVLKALGLGIIKRAAAAPGRLTSASAPPDETYRRHAGPIRQPG